MLCCSRPTAVNLGEAAKRLQALAKRASAGQGADGPAVSAAVAAACEAMLAEDITANQVLRGQSSCLWYNTLPTPTCSV